MIDAELVTHISWLARLSFTTAEAEAMRQDLAAVLEYVRQLEQCDVTEVLPMTHPLDLPLPLRADEPGQGLPLPLILGNAPRQEDGGFKVPPILPHVPRT